MPASFASLEDFRILKLAEMYERAYEAFILDTALGVVEDEKVRASLLRLAGPSERQRARLHDELARLRATLSAEDKAGVVRAALLDVMDVERAARRFYLETADRVHDPRLAALFREYAREEQAHVKIAEDTLVLAGARAGAAPTRILNGDEIPLREGVSDFGHATH